MKKKDKNKKEDKQRKWTGSEHSPNLDQEDQNNLTFAEGPEIKKSNSTPINYPLSKGARKTRTLTEVAQHHIESIEERDGDSGSEIQSTNYIRTTEATEK